jgi:hypothetical protein
LTLFLFFLPFLSFHRSSSPSVSSSVSFSSPPPLLYENYSHMGCWQFFFGPILCLWQREKKVEANPQIRDRPPVRTELSTLRRGEVGRADGSRAVKGTGSKTVPPSSATIFPQLPSAARRIINSVDRKKKTTKHRRPPDAR